MIFQYGTMAGIIEGAYSGSLTIEELLKYGNFGIGTFDGIDGEMVILDSKVYKTDYFGNSYLQSTKKVHHSLQLLHSKKNTRNLIILRLKTY